jgi:hypothetical protein
MPTRENLVGRTFGRLTVLNECETRMIGKTIKRSRVFWKCQCKCGTSVFVESSHLKVGDTNSCGCIRKELGYARRKHGRSHTIEHNTWQRMKQRCYNPNDRRFASYGGRGITVCDRWKNSFDHFLQDMGNSPSPRHSLDRLDNNGHYEPANCRWATNTEQCRNTRRNRLLTHRGKTQSVADWSDETGIPSIVIRTRIDKLGWGVHDALSVPVDINKRHKHRLLPRKHRRQE